ncbi:MAG: CoA-binding protein, partial [Nitrospirae bacterium]
REPEKVGHSILKNLIDHGFKGGIYPVNPKAPEILGQKAYPSVTSINRPCDLAVVAVPARVVPTVLRDCTNRGIKVAVVISAGFKEAGREGMALEREITRIAEASGLRLLGPNCLGVINTFSSLNATFAAGMPERGRVSFFSQSGALGVAILDWALQNRLGFSKFISLGNKADLSEIDFIEYFMNDSQTDVILGYIEDVVDGKRFIKVARRCTKKKPIILIKSGSTGAGARAASSHTGALAGSEVAFNAAFKQSGVIRARGVKELFELARVFLSGRLPSNDTILVVTNAGGPGIIAADEAERAGLKLIPTPDALVKKLRRFLPRHASLYNPIDILGDANSERYGRVLEALSSTRVPFSMVVILTPQAMTDVDNVADKVIETHSKSRKPIVTVFMGGNKVKGAVERLKDEGIPNYSYPEEAMACMRHLVAHARWRKRTFKKPSRYEADRTAAREIIKKAYSEGRQALTEDEARQLFQCYGIRVPVSAFVREPEEALIEADRIGYPLVMKVVSPDIIHKSDVGGVVLDIKTPSELKDAYYRILASVKRAMPEARIKGFLLSEMLQGGREVIVGLTEDRSFGHLLMFGLGGVYVELLKDVSFRVVPVTGEEIIEMIHEVKAYGLLSGARGQRPADIGAIVEVMERTNQMAMELPGIQELDINPLMVMEKGALAIDARVILKEGP